MTIRLLPLVLSAPLLAGELTVERGPFRIEHQFTATAIPSEPSLIALEPESWSDFTIETIIDHGSVVKKGDVLITFEREPYERKLEDLTRSLAQKKVALATAETDLAKLTAETELELEAARISKAQAGDDLKYFKEVGRPAEEAELSQNEKQYQFRLDAEKEELAQLKQMYEEDDLTEATEEIILKRQLISIEAAEFDLAEIKRRNERARTTTLPRRQESLERAAKAASIKLEKAEANLPRAIQTAKLELESSKVTHDREQLELERITKDGAWLEIKAPSDGVFFLGSLEDGQWKLGDLAKALVPAGKVPTNRVVASIAPDTPAIPLSARLDPDLSRSLTDSSTVSISLAGREDVKLIGTVSNPPGVPAADGKDPITIAVEWPEDLVITPTTSANCLAVIYERDDSISVPTKALQAAADGSWSVELKMTEGKTKRRTVERGRATKEQVEILSGLEAGQVIVVPD
jgi:multidrug resistance efflux pump